MMPSSLVRYLHSADHDPAIIRKNDKNFRRQPDFKQINFSVKSRYNHKIDKKRTVSALAIFCYEDMENIKFLYEKIPSKDMLVYC